LRSTRLPRLRSTRLRRLQGLCGRTRLPRVWRLWWLRRRHLVGRLRRLQLRALLAMDATGLGQSLLTAASPTPENVQSWTYTVA
jgi:hypothetical protein